MHPRNRRQLKVIVGGLGVVALLIGVATLVDWRLSRPSVERDGGRILLVDSRPWGISTEVIFGVGMGGRLAADRNGCVGLVTGGPVSEDESVYSFRHVIWEHGTRLLDGGDLRIEFDGKIYAEGDEIVAGGYDVYRGEYEHADMIPEECRTGSYAVVSSD